LDGRKVGEIRLLPKGFRYYPKGSMTPGKAFPSLLACEASIES
jgi:hypothetical protein